MGQRIEVKFQMDEDELETALTDIRGAFSQLDDPFVEVHRLLVSLSYKRNRCLVDPYAPWPWKDKD